MGEDSVARQNHGFIADYDDLAQDPGEALGHIASLARLLRLASDRPRTVDEANGDSELFEL
jgi:hypothetical protein